MFSGFSVFSWFSLGFWFLLDFSRFLRFFLGFLKKKLCASTGSTVMFLMEAQICFEGSTTCAFARGTVCAFTRSTTYARSIDLLPQEAQPCFYSKRKKYNLCFREKHNLYFLEKRKNIACASPKKNVKTATVLSGFVFFSFNFSGVRFFCCPYFRFSFFSRFFGIFFLFSVFS